MNNVTIQSGFAEFAPRARLLRLIGSELISDDVVAITELVKNAHDADASFVSLQFINVTGSDGEILIRDDGHGMDLETLLTRWMQPAGSSKGREGTRFTPGRRRVLGEKGVGRFAADKLASRLELVSRRRGESSEVHAVFNWDEYDADDLMLSEVKSRWEVRPADWLDTHGTMLRLTGLRTRWTERMFRRLCTRLARLVSPFVASNGFRISIESDEFPRYSGDVAAGFLKDAPYQIEAEFDGLGTATVRINNGRAVRHALNQESPRCGPVHVRLFAFDLETEALARIGPRAEVRAWLREWTGISVYRDGFRVWPYGEPHDDWLRLDQRRVNNPVVRLSNNQIVGFVAITSDANPELRDQTNREGLIHNEALEDLQQFVLFAMQLLEAERQSLRHPQARRQGAGQETRASREAAAIPDALEAAARRAEGQLAEDLRRIATRARAGAAGEAQTRRRMLEGFTELAAAGQTAFLVGRSVAACLADLRQVCASLRTSMGRDNADEMVRATRTLLHIDRTLTGAAEQLSLASAAQPGAGKRRRGLDVPAELTSLRDLADLLLQTFDASLDIVAPKGAVLRTDMRPEMFVAVMSALLANSLEWKHAARPLKITATIRGTEDEVEIIYADSGQGVTPGLEDTLFEPMVSGRPGGAGMGLTVARSILETHGGSIALVSDRRRRGAAFRIRLPRKKARATRAPGT